MKQPYQRNDMRESIASSGIALNWGGASNRVAQYTLIILIALWVPVALGDGADLAVTNANVLTMRSLDDRAQAFAIHQGRFVAVGALEEVEPWIGPETQTIDAEGGVIVPGFIDAHMHPRPIYPELSRLGSVDLRPSSVSSIEDLIARLRQKAEVTPSGEWIYGQRYEDTKLGRHPTREDLDRASTEHPIFIGHSSGHLGVVNSIALDLAAIGIDSSDPPGGAFDRNDQGAPNGICRESAMQIVRAAGPQPEPATRDESTRGMRRCLEQFLAKGLTSVVDAGIGPQKFESSFTIAACASSSARIAVSSS